MSGTIVGPSDWPPSSEPPAFDVFPGGHAFWMVEVATAPELMEPAGEADRTEANYYLGGDSAGFFASGSQWTMPQDVWEKLGVFADRLYYRLYTSESDSEWLDWTASVDDGDWANLPSVHIGFPGSPVQPSPNAAADVAALCRYLGIQTVDFEVEQDRYFARLGELLAVHGVVNSADEINAGTFRAAVTQFQQQTNLDDDGIPGEDTLWELNESWAEARDLELVRVDMDLWTPPGVTTHVQDNHGYSSARVRSDVSDDVAGLRADLNALGVLMTTSGSTRPLNATVTPGRSPTSIHYSAAAIDLATVSGMARTASANATNQLYVITEDGDQWRIWARSDFGDELTLDAVEWSNGATTTRLVEDRFVEVTEMAAARNLGRIGPRSSFPDNYLSAEWWHLQSTSVLIPWISQFGAEIISMADYSVADVRAQTPIWTVRKRIFHKASNGWW
jgi:hypothetical protein